MPTNPPTTTTNPESIKLSEGDLLWLAIHENGGDIVIPVKRLSMLPPDRYVTFAITDDRSMLVITASGAVDYEQI
jgi:hypothetical protein